MKAYLLNPVHIFRHRERIQPTLRRWLRNAGIALNENDRRLRALRDVHRGRRAFIVGNGPSLRIEDLHRLGDEVTFASNKIFLAFDQTAWRPSYYSVSDRLVAKNNAETIRGLAVKMLHSDLTRPFLDGCADVCWVHEMNRNFTSFQQDGDAIRLVPAPYFSRNVFRGMDSGDTVVYMQMQLAYYMGIREVYLMGIDFHFAIPSQVATTGIKTQAHGLVSTGEVNHFHPEYRKPGEVWGIPRLDRQYRAFLRARLEFEQAGGRILNASRQTRLDAFQTCSLDELF